MPAQRVFFAEDDPVFADLMTRFLEEHGLAVTRFADGAGVVDRVVQEKPDAVILDGTLPTVDGFHVCRELRLRYDGPILLLTACNEDVDEIVGLNLGADDYIKKPVEPRVLLARLKARFRRHEPAEAGGEPRFGTLAIDRACRTVRVGEAPVDLTTAEFDLLWVLASRAGETLSRDELLRATRGVDYDGVDRSMDIRVSRLRRLVGDDGDPPRLIRTVRGKGYLFARIDWP